MDDRMIEFINLSNIFHPSKIGKERVAQNEKG